jgi:hypothetical protein
MPLVFLCLGILFLVTAIRGTHEDMFSLLKSELWGKDSFLPWVSAFLVLGLLGYYKPVRPMTNALIGLIVLVLILTQGTGFFDRFQSAIASPQAPAKAGAGDGGAGAGVDPGAGFGSPVASQSGMDTLRSMQVGKTPVTSETLRNVAPQFGLGSDYNPVNPEVTSSWLRMFTR